ncbi:MAG: phosphatase PAP2 family protein [Massilibacteroides sp.]|nr:phosphatase PAP2 family protein [Massilibacteroides sp.]MDD3062002.1 phosphatase PAP2 family protein [Massilibacteroides sp.]MDD4114057.1 phosphatase PAP2 family protein [Massilibacteroides sp.]MDD4659281.1 phosphatase PAP2 family protein [Massilibacteroides sp.]
MNHRIHTRIALFLLFTFLCSLKVFPLIPLDSLSIEQTTVQIEKKEKMPIIHYSFNAKKLILPTSLIATGILGTVVDGWSDFHLFSRKKSVKRIRVDDYMEWGMFGWVFVCDIFAKEKHNFVDQFFLLALAEGFNAGMVHGLKNTIDETRPDGAPYSFPSGHTANAFLGAHLAYKEFKDSAPALGYAGYAMATLVGISRIYNNRHWISDTLAGAGIGILSVELSYLTYFPIRNFIAKQVNEKVAKQLVLTPSFSSYGSGIYFSFRF